MVRFQLYWWRKTSGALPCIISGTNRHLSRTTNHVHPYIILMMVESWYKMVNDCIQQQFCGKISLCADWFESILMM
jgi:hypothetical protein